MPGWLSSRLTDRGRDGADDLAALVDQLVPLMQSEGGGMLRIGGTVPAGLLRPAHEIMQAAQPQQQQQAQPQQQHAGGGEGTHLRKRLFDQ